MTEKPDAIRKILIVGGGSAGWMAATYLKRFLRHTECSITLVESEDIGTIGVGEATIPRIVQLIRNLRFDEAEFMRRCHATYKLGIQFREWHRPDHAYWHPFGVCGGTIDGIDLFHFWVKSIQAGHDEGPFSSYSLQALLAEAHKAPRSLRGSSPIMEAGAYAFHLDTAALAGFLSEVSVREGVEHIVDEVRNVVMGEGGLIERIETRDGRTLQADLYVDCTGFQARLMEQALGDPWIDWSHLLLCDRAVVLHLPSDEAMHPYTRATALDAGWRWQIPLSHRVGCGYVYSSAHAADESALEELMAGLPPRDAMAAAPRYLRMRVGRRRTFWSGNCVAVGLSSGFIEPLESTGLYFIQIALELLMEYFPDRTFNQALKSAYNESMSSVYDETRDFILLHYLLSRREDSRFWRDSRSVEVPDALRDLLALYDEAGIVPQGLSPFPPTSYHFILAGNGRLPRRPSPHAHRADFQEVRQIMDRIRARNLDVADPLPTHQALMRSLHAEVG
jgi:tryptophan halogenase